MGRERHHPRSDDPEGHEPQEHQLDDGRPFPRHIPTRRVGLLPQNQTLQSLHCIGDTKQHTLVSMSSRTSTFVVPPTRLRAFLDGCSMSMSRHATCSWLVPLRSRFRIRRFVTTSRCFVRLPRARRRCAFSHVAVGRRRVCFVLDLDQSSTWVDFLKCDSKGSRSSRQDSSSSDPRPTHLLPSFRSRTCASHDPTGARRCPVPPASCGSSAPAPSTRTWDVPRRAKRRFARRPCHVHVACLLSLSTWEWSPVENTPRSMPGNGFLWDREPIEGRTGRLKGDSGIEPERWIRTKGGQGEVERRIHG